MYKTKNKKFFFLVIILTILVIGLIGNVNAANQTITNTTNGGLKTAIENVNNGDTVYLESGIYSGVNNTNLTISKNITISGKGNVVIDAKGINRIFYINPIVNVTIKNLKLINGKDSNGGAICSYGDLFVSTCTFTNNQAAGEGGAIYSLDGTIVSASTSTSLSVNGCTFTNNQAVYSGGAIASADNYLSVSGSTFINNQVNKNYGGAICASVGSLFVSGSTFKNNQANEGGAIYKTAVLGDRSFSVSGSTFTNNQAKSFGGAICSSNSHFSVNGSTFTNNQANNNGGAISVSYCILILDSVTFKNNMIASRYNAIHSNNIISSVFKNKVKITPAENTPIKADLKITKITKKGNYRHVTIKNIGKRSIGNKFYLGVYIGKKRIKSTLIKSLGVGKSREVKVLIAKKYRNKLKTFKADGTNRVKESNEKNNSCNAR